MPKPPSHSVRFSALLKLVSLDPAKSSKEEFVKRILEIICEVWETDSVQILEKVSQNMDDNRYTKYCPEIKSPIQIDLPSGYSKWVIEHNRFLLIERCDLRAHLGYGSSGEPGDVRNVRPETIKYVLRPPSTPPLKLHERSLIVHPLSRRGSIIGTIKLCNYREEGHFSLEDVTMFHPFGEAIATLLHNVTLMNALQVKNAELQTQATEQGVLLDRMRLSESLAFGAMMAHQHLHELSGLVTALFSCQESVRFQAEALRISGKERENLQKTIAEFDRKLRDVQRKIKGLLKREPKAEDLRLEAHNLKTIVEEELRPYGRTFERERIHLRKTLGKANVMVIVDEYSLRYVIRIIVNNAINALAEVSARNRRLHVGSNKSNGWVHVFFRDTGCGITPGNMKRVFEAFFTTDPDHRNGVGLFFAKTIVEAYFGGRLVLLHSYPDEGAKFQIELPIAKKEV